MMSDKMWFDYLNLDSQVHTVSVTLSGASQQIFPRNPLRRLLIIPSNNLTMNQVVLGEGAAGVYQITVPTASPCLILDWDSIGDFLTMPVAATAQTGSASNQVFTEISVSVKRWNVYMEAMYAELAKLGAS